MDIHTRIHTHIITQDMIDKAIEHKKQYDAAREQAELDAAAVLAARAERAKQEHIETILLEVIPPRYRDAGFYRVEKTQGGERAAQARNAAYEYSVQFDGVSGDCLLICGLINRGKTYLSMCIARALITKGFNVKRRTASQLVREVRQAWGGRTAEKRTEQQIIDSFVKPDLLIIEEVCKQFDTQAERLSLFDIIDGRYEAKKSTLLVSNGDMSKVKTSIGEESFSRMGFAETGNRSGGKVIVCDWEV